MKTVAPLALLALLASCSPAPGGEAAVDGGGNDAGATDAGPDAGVPPDAGLDAGTPDAGTDAGFDAGLPDAGLPTSLALTVSGMSLVTRDGGAVEVRGGISCCGGGPYGWPLFNETWSDLIASYGGNFLHVRVGPFRTEGNGETDWAPVGGGYVETGGKADLSRFNEVFWARVRALIQHARDRKQWVEVDVIDGWAIKHCRAGDIPGYSAWDSAFNLQGANHCTAAGKAAIVPGSLHDQWVRKVVFETGRFDNVIYQDGNEVGLLNGYNPAWTKSMHDLIRAEEAARGYLRHLFGTNSGDPAAMQLPEVDYLEFHQNNALTAGQCYGKPCFVNEYNPSPALTAAQFKQRFCAARLAGTGFWYWRHEQTDTQMNDSLAALAGSCP